MSAVGEEKLYQRPTASQSLEKGLLLVVGDALPYSLTLHTWQSTLPLGSAVLL